VLRISLQTDIRFVVCRCPCWSSKPLIGGLLPASSLHSLGLVIVGLGLAYNLETEGDRHGIEARISTTNQGLLGLTVFIEDARSIALSTDLL
jgi:hypothetical protein